MELKNNFLTKLKLLQNRFFLKRISFLDPSFEVILTSVTDDITVWGNCDNLDYIKSLQALHGRWKDNF